MTGAYYYRLAERPRTTRSSCPARWPTDTARSYTASRDSDQYRHTEATLKRAGILHRDHGPHHVSDDVLYSLEPGPWLTTTEPPGRGGGRARGGRSGGIGRGGGNAVSTELGRGATAVGGGVVFAARVAGAPGDGELAGGSDDGRRYRRGRRQVGDRVVDRWAERELPRPPRRPCP